MIDYHSNTSDLSQITRNWAYSMRRTMQEIIPGVYLGPYSAAQRHSLPHLIQCGITHIICVRQDKEAHFIKPQIFDASLTYLTLDIADSQVENILRFFVQVRQFIDDALYRKGKVLVHGNTGISRSATLVLAYVMEKFRMTAKDALDYVKRRRGCVHPNESFISQLMEYEPIYRARNMLEAGGSTQKRSKRKLDQDGTIDSNEEYTFTSTADERLTSVEKNLSSGDYPTHLCHLWMLKQ